MPEGRTPLYISGNWPCAYWNEEDQQFLIVFVDDMKLVVPTHLMEEAWIKLGEGISLEKPRGAMSPRVKRKCFFGM